MIRTATEADFDFIRAIQSDPANLKTIAEDSLNGLAHYLTDAHTDLLIWEQNAMPQGFIVLAGVNYKDVVELRRLALKSPGQGQGQAVIADIIAYSFDMLDAQRLWFDVAADNTRARRAYERAGFTYEGTLRQHWLRRSGDRADLALYGMLRDERP
ncbi:MAG: GNAT family protein [Pseudomonadota bacterium]